MAIKEGEVVLWRLDRLYRVAATLPTPEAVRQVVFAKVDQHFSGDYLEIAEKLRERYGSHTAVFLTAAELDKVFDVMEEDGVKLGATVAMSPPSCVGTINLALFVDMPLSRWGLLDLLKTVVEAKCITVVNRLLRCGGRRSPGTVTDAVVVGAPAESKELQHFAGLATEVGRRAASLVKTLLSRLDRYDPFERALGVSKSEFLDIFSRLVEKAPLPVKREDVLEELERILKDPNVWALVIAASELDAVASEGHLPGLSVEEYLRDSSRVVADELLGVALADYLGGFNAVLTTYWIERVKKSGGFKELAMFSDDVLSALLAGVYLSLYKKNFNT
ncbi:MAG: bifunctional adenosylcobinamide hydrolase/alpha-ribazole phosphatase CbiS [Pyrobaculum sp.]